MTREDIIRMAREAGLETHERKGQVRIGSAVFTGGDSTESMMRFAALVTEAERAAEREACIRDVRSYGGIHIYDAGKIVEAIRARGSK